jgi:hypothetical protein
MVNAGPEAKTDRAAKQPTQIKKSALLMSLPVNGGDGANDWNLICGIRFIHYYDTEFGHFLEQKRRFAKLSACIRPNPF